MGTGPVPALPHLPRAHRRPARAWAVGVPARFSPANAPRAAGALRARAARTGPGRALAGWLAGRAPGLAAILRGERARAGQPRGRLAPAGRLDQLPRSPRKR